MKKYIIPACLLIAGAVTRLIFFGYPAQTVFDEVHYGYYLTYYHLGQYVFDVHPPLARMLMYIWGELLHNTYTGVDFSNIGHPLPYSVVLIRLLPIITGILLPVVVYAVCRKLGISKLYSSLAGIFLIFENSLVVQSRFILPDAFLILFGFLSLLFYLLYRERKIYHFLDEEGKYEIYKHLDRYDWFFVASAVFAAFSVGVKWTGLAFALLVIILELYKISASGWRTNAPKKIKYFIKIAMLYSLLIVAIYISIFAVNFSMLQKSGPGDTYMTPQFQKTLEGNKFADNPSIRPEPFSVKLIDLNITMLAANSRISGKAPYSSRWYTWPLMLRPVFYWQIPYTNFIYYLGNPLVYWLGTLSMAISICAMAWIVLRRKPRSGNIGIQFFVVAGYLVNYLPFIFIGRVMFLYHYEAALVFSIIAMAYLLECTFVSKTWRRSLFAILAIVCIVSFIYFSPLTYGTHLTNDELQSRMWLSTWR